MSLKFYLLIPCLLLSISAPILAEQKEVESGERKNILTHCERVKNEDFRFGEEYLATYIQDTWDIVTFPVRWKWSDWLLGAGVLGATTGLFFLDEDIRSYAQSHRTHMGDELTKIGRRFGEGQYTLPPLALIYLYGHFFEDKRARKLALLTLEGFAVTGIFTQLIKFGAHRHRPSTGEGADRWDGPGFSKQNLAFPSGHTSSAASVATIIASEYENTIVIPALAYGMAGLTAYARVNENGHWASDVFFAYALGFFTSRFIYNIHSRKGGGGARVFPSLEGDGAYLNCAWRF